MHTLVLYSSKFGNTEAIARAIAEGAADGGNASVTVLDEEAASRSSVDTPDLVLIGGPTHNHGPSAGLRALAALVAARHPHVPAACFDTRYRGPVLLMGSGAAVTAKTLAKAGVDLVAPPQSFFIARRGSVATQTLEPGEIERAQAWGRTVAAAAASRAGVLAG